MENFDDLFDSKAAPDHQESPDGYDKAAYAEKKQQERRDAFSLMDETAVKLAGKPELLRAFLDVQARFDRYSVGNALLITAQLPTATKLADAAKWKEDGVYVNRGETGIVIMEPGKEYTRDDGSTAVGYRVRKVFDISQTNAKPEPEPVPTRDERLMLRALIHKAPCDLAVSDQLPVSSDAVYRDAERKIFIRPNMTGTQIFRALSCELAQAYLHERQKDDYKRSAAAFTAKCASYILCVRNGVSTDGISFDHIPDSVGRMDARAMRSQLDEIRSVANDISFNMGQILDAHQKDARSTSEPAR